MKDLSILKPVMAQALLTFAVLFLMAYERFKAFRAGSVVNNGPGVRPSWPGRAGTVSNAYHNLLEMPMLFFAVCAFALLADAADGEMVVLAWLYVALRAAQALIHTTNNKIPLRFAAFVLSNIALMAMWVNLALSVLLGW
jgi:hypothetical protein